MSKKREMTRPLPSNVDPIQAARLGLWLLGRRQQTAALLRRKNPVPKYVGVHTKAIPALASLILPWHYREYPGAALWLTTFCGVSKSTAKRWLRGGAVSDKQRLRLLLYLEQHIAEAQAVCVLMREKPRPAKRRGVTRRANTPPHT